MRIAVSAFCLNEIKHVDRWWASVKEADAVIVLDTGSTDGTPERLMALGAIVHQQKFPDPFRFDTAGNRALELVPDDIDLVLIVDLDEVVRPAAPWTSWTEAVCATWPKWATRGWYGYVWNWTREGKPGVFFQTHRLFRRGAYRWRRPCHPVLEYAGEAGTDAEVDMTRALGILQFADPGKSRTSYLPLLKLSVEENPGDATAHYYYARELTFHGQWADATRAFLFYLSRFPDANTAERMSAMRYIAHGAVLQGRGVNAEHWLRMARDTDNSYREPLIDLVALYASMEDHVAALAYLNKALSIKKRPVTMYAEPVAWDDDMLKEMRARLVRRINYESKQPIQKEAS